MKMEALPKQKVRLDKLIDATNAEEEKNDMVSEITKRIEQYLSPFPQFIGVFPFDSRIQGYSSEEIIKLEIGGKESNYVMYILEDKNQREGDCVREQLIGIEMEYRQKGIKIHCIEQFYSKQDISDLLSSIDDRTVQSDYYIWSFANLFRSGRGEKIISWRNFIKNEFSKMPKEKRERTFVLFINWLVSVDKKAVEKTSESTLNIDHDGYLNARRELWTKRIHKIFG